MPNERPILFSGPMEARADEYFYQHRKEWEPDLATNIRFAAGFADAEIDRLRANRTFKTPAEQREKALTWIRQAICEEGFDFVGMLEEIDGPNGTYPDISDEGADKLAEYIVGMFERFLNTEI